MQPSYQQLEDEIASLQQRLRESEELVRAIQGGGIDALVVPGHDGDRVFTLTGSDHAYRILIEAMSECAVTLSAEGEILYCNQRTATLLGIPLERLIGTRFRDHVASADAARFDALLARGAHAAVKDELLLQAPGGAKIPAILSLSSLLPHGLPALCLIVTDLTEQKRSQELLAVRERLELAQAAARIGTFEWDIRSDRVHWTAELEALYGLRPGTFEGTYAGWIDRVHPADRPGAERAIALAKETGVFAAEFRVVWTDGSVHWLAAKGRMQFEGGVPVRHLGINIDITERRQAEAELAVKAEELERSNSDLRHFATVASHDLQEPLRMISSYLGLLDRRYGELFDDSAKSFIAYARDGAARMSEMIRALLAYSSLSSKPIEIDEIALADALADALANLAGPIAARSASITHDPLPRLRADRTQVARLLQNLIGNGIKFSRKASSSVHVSAERVEGEWVVSVRDDGIGIDPAHRERIFQMFHRLHGVGDYPGSGIGLASCKRIVERHGGRIWVESQPGEGSCFRFALPT